ncbi:MAG: NmrA/HSCARG family protein [Acidobacteriota bacterium]|nr:MAG: NmrA/HSCARG family protein [Acidobacteriota bacterium]
MTNAPIRLIVATLLLSISCAPSSRQEAGTNAPLHDRVVLVTGATGRQGGAVARHLLARDVTVRALTRRPDSERAQRLAAAGAQIVKGDFDDRASLARALEGVYGVFSVQDFWEHGYDGEVRQGKALADEAKAAGIEHFVYTSVASADRGTGIPHFESKWQVEQHIRSIGLPYTILRPVSFMENWEWQREQILGGKLAMPLRPETRFPQIAVDDIGRFVAEAFEDPGTWIGKELDIAGDAGSVRDVVQIFSRVLDRSISYEQIAWDTFPEQAGDELTAMYRWFDEVGYDVDVDELRAEYPFLTGFETYLREKEWLSER